MSIWRGAQSAIFFYVSCAPCLDSAHRKRRKRQAERDEHERQEVKKIHPHYPQQAGPGSTNDAWQREIEAGPKIDKETWKEDQKRMREGRGGYTESQRGLKTSATQSSVGSKAQSSLEGYPGHKHNMVYQQPYQRPDEGLWGMPSTSTVNLPSRPPTAKSRYHLDNHPAVNDLHPALTRKITHADEVAWMLQPPPVASVMQGLEPPGRSRSNSDLESKRKTVSERHSAAPLEFERALEAPFESDEEAFIDTEVASPAFHTPRSDAQPEEWVYAQTRREVSARRSLEW